MAFMRQGSTLPSIDGVNLRQLLVPTVRAWLASGVSDDVIRSSVCMKALKPIVGGLKSEFVGRLELELEAVIKIGNHELLAHRNLMSHVNTYLGKRKLAPIFPEVIAVEKIANGRYLMFMQGLAGFVPFETLLYKDSGSSKDLRKALKLALEMCRRIHTLPLKSIGQLTPDIGRTPDPFPARIIDKLRAVIKADPDLASLNTLPGKVLGIYCPPLNVIRNALAQWPNKTSHRNPPRLVHGDPHLGNILVRIRPAQISVRLIDPNPEVGLSDPFYDYGKLLHFLEPVGWYRVQPDKCRSSWQTSRDRWELKAFYEVSTQPVERHRRFLENLVKHEACTALRKSCSQPEGTLLLSTAAAHLGLAALLVKKEEKNGRRFALAYALKSLANWFSLGRSLSA